MKKFSYPLILALFFSSCTTLLPTFTYIEDVSNLRKGDSRSDVEKKLGISFYNLDNYDENGNYTAVYYYRVNERRVSRFANPNKTNGDMEKSRFYMLEASFNSSDKLVSYTTGHAEEGFMKFKRVSPIIIGAPIVISLLILIITSL